MPLRPRHHHDPDADCKHDPQRSGGGEGVREGYVGEGGGGGVGKEGLRRLEEGEMKGFRRRGGL